MQKKYKYKYLFILIACMAWAFTASAQQPFTAGNIVVYRVGDGSAVLGASAVKVYLDEYTSNGVLVQSILMPTVTNGSNSLLTVAGGDNTGFLNLSADGKLLVLPGSNIPLGTSANPTAQVIGLVDFDGNINTATVITDAAENGRKASTAISDDGNRIWFGAHRVLRYTTRGSSTSVLLTTGARSLIDLEITNNQLYGAYLNAAFSPKVGMIGAGLPSATGQVMTDLPGLPATILDPGQFAFADLDPNVPGADVLYLADGTYTISATAGIRKYSLVGGLWVDNGSVGASVANSYYRGLTIRVSGTSVTVFATKAGSTGIQGQELVKLTDNSGYNATLTGTPVVLATVAVPNTMAFRGVARVPVGCPSVAGLQVPDISSTAVIIRWNAPAGGSGNYEYAVTTTPDPPASWTPTSNTSVAVGGLLNATIYYAHVRTSCDAIRKSEWSTSSFVTGCKAPPPALVAIDINNSGSLTAKWKKVFGAAGYEYAISTNATPPSSGTAISDSIVTVANLNAVTSYYLHVRSNCGGGAFSPWITKPFTTGCFMSAPGVTVHTKNASVRWNRVSNAVKYEYAVSYTGTAPTSGTYTTDTVYTTKDVNDGRSYYFHVRGVCNTGTVSEWNTVSFNPQGLQVYPNPVRDLLQIRLNGIAGTSPEIIVTDITGRIMNRSRMNNNTASLFTAAWAPGIYFVHYYDGKNRHSVSVLKQ